MARGVPPGASLDERATADRLYIGTTLSTEGERLVLSDGCALAEVYVSPEPADPLRGFGSVLGATVLSWPAGWGKR